METKLNENYWTSRYLTKNTGWDLGQVSPPLKQYLDQITDRSLKILIPGAGNAYEAAYAFQVGFQNIHVLDLSDAPLADFQARNPHFPSEQLHQQDFFAHQGQYDLILEQTFFCALQPALRPAYVRQMATLLAPGGKLVGVLFNRYFEKEGPPFGGEAQAYEGLFAPHFERFVQEPCHNSIGPRAGNELFFRAYKSKM
ncbi:MAG: methyltransferase domain-containing protein [Nitritalea sp.]